MNDLDLDAIREEHRGGFAGADIRALCSHVEIAKDIRDEQRRKTPHEIRALPSRFEPDDERRRRLRDGAAFCRLELGITPGEMQPLDPKNPVRDRAQLKPC